MRRGGSILVTILVLIGVFYLGVLYERNDCKIQVPGSTEQVDNSVRCRDFRSDLPSTVTTAPPP